MRMTNEEVINILKELTDYKTNFAIIGALRCEALNMAIKALEQLQEKPEYIDIWNVGAILRNIPVQPDICKIYGGVCGYPIEACSECPKHEGWRPPKEQTRWIPVSERLPEIHQNVLLSLRSLDIEVGFRAETEPYFYCQGDYIEPQNVLAWMPLPEPYKESEDKE